MNRQAPALAVLACSPNRYVSNNHKVDSPRQRLCRQNFTLGFRKYVGMRPLPPSVGSGIIHKGGPTASTQQLKA